VPIGSRVRSKQTHASTRSIAVGDFDATSTVGHHSVDDDPEPPVGRRRIPVTGRIARLHVERMAPHW
jgi:hypothetical protein